MTLCDSLKAARPPTQLTDDQLEEFLERGCLILSASEVPAEVHERIYEQCKALADDNPSNDIYERIPELQSVFESPTVAGALQSVLGDGYLMHRHRHMHSSSGRDQVFHKDSHCAPPAPCPTPPHPTPPHSASSPSPVPWGSAWAGGINRMRHHRSRIVMVLYYPHTVSAASGPTAVVPVRPDHPIPCPHAHLAFERLDAVAVRRARICGSRR